MPSAGHPGQCSWSVTGYPLLCSCCWLLSYAIVLCSLSIPPTLYLHHAVPASYSGLSAVLLQPVLEAVSNSVMGMVCVLNKADPSDGRDIFFEPTFTPSDW